MLERGLVFFVPVHQRITCSRGDCADIIQRKESLRSRTCLAHSRPSAEGEECWSQPTHGIDLEMREGGCSLCATNEGKRPQIGERVERKFNDNI